MRERGRIFWICWDFGLTETLGTGLGTADSIEPDGAAVLGGFVDEHPKVKASKAVAAQVRLRMLVLMLAM
ncbi:hypothetical protein [Microcoleus vaginatus]|uniref:hypothetical protein n=1 Tax=Microcoleus vaginatus TaxID=119532 RepID=UPI00403F6DA4